MSHRKKPSRTTVAQRPTTAGAPAPLRLFLAEAIEELAADERRVVCARYGIEREERDVEEIGRALGLTTTEIWDIEAQALATIGFLAITSTSANDRRHLRKVHAA
jgi:DNA-directed RNA polymerase sigma subunit (sigma70/sigma32)